MRILFTSSMALVSLALLSTTVCSQEPAQDDKALARSDFMAAVYREWSAPRSADFAHDSAQLGPSLQALCDAPHAQAEDALLQARQHWLTALSSWDRLSAVAIGPLIERRSQRQIDFTPARPPLIEKAVKSAPASLADMELIGTPAKGLPALEWMLWVRPVSLASPECRYAVWVAAEIGHEASALSTAFKQAADASPGREAAASALAELVNQWVGGLERLSWSNMELPARVAITSNRGLAAKFPHLISDATLLSWMAQWEALRALATGNGFSMEVELRTHGYDKVADSLANAVREANTAMQAVNINDLPQVLDAAKALAALKLLVEISVAPALSVNIGFSDADGD